MPIIAIRVLRPDLSTDGTVFGYHHVAQIETP
jgi:hypothetical protein